MNRSKSKGAVSLAVAQALLPFLLAAFAHDADAQEIDEVVVTASKRGEQSTQDTPIAVQAMSSDFQPHCLRCVNIGG